MIKEKIINDIYDILKDEINKEDIIVERPKDKGMADYAIPCFSLAKKLHKSPIEIANNIKEKLKGYEKIETVNGYLNIFVNKNEYSKQILEEIMNEKDNYGYNCSGLNKNVIVEYSSPNIAKPFGVGHLRSTVIGEALKNICLKNGYNVSTLNYLGDYGTQFGKLIYAFKTWGNQEEYKKDPIHELKRVYVKFHEEATINPDLDNEGRMWFKKLEDKDEEALKLWKEFRNDSLKEFEKTYELLNINKFDSYEGESLYIDLMPGVISILEEKKLLEESEGAMVIKLGDDIVPALIKRSDGASLYMTREVAAVLDRKKRYNFDEALYVVGNEQQLHFTQLKRIIDRMGYDWSNSIHHINFGMILQDGKKMSTRHGKSIELKDLLNEAIDLSKKCLIEKNAKVDDIEQSAKVIGIGAVVFNDLKNYRINDIEFNLDEILNFVGETGPYIQYTYARINSILNKKDEQKTDYNIDISDIMWNVVFKLYEFKNAVIKAKENYDPSEIAKYLLELATVFNKLYANEKIVSDDKNKTEFLLKLSQCTAIVLKEGMRVLGIKVLNRM